MCGAVCLLDLLKGSSILFSPTVTTSFNCSPWLKTSNALTLSLDPPFFLRLDARTHTHTHPYYDEFTNQRPRPGASLHEQNSAFTIHRKLKYVSRLRRSQDTLWRETTYTFFCHTLHPFSTRSWKFISAFMVRVRECKPCYGTFFVFTKQQVVCIRPVQAPSLLCEHSIHTMTFFHGVVKIECFWTIHERVKQITGSSSKRTGSGESVPTIKDKNPYH